MSCHIAFEEAGLKFEPMISKKSEVDRLNPQGAVPVLLLDDGTVLTQNIAVLTYAASQSSGAHLLPKLGTTDYFKAYQWLSWVASDLHPSYSPLFDKETPAAARAESIAEVLELLTEVNSALEGRQFLVGSALSIADCYLYAVYNWSRFVKIDTSNFKNLNAFAARMTERPSVQRVMAREGLKS